jgi:hypothetical protein
MSIVLEFTPREEAFLREKATEQKIDIATYIHKQVFPPQSNTSESTEVSLLREMAIQSVTEARKDLHAKGIGYVESQKDKVVRCLPDGSREDIGEIIPPSANKTTPK